MTEPAAVFTPEALGAPACEACQGTLRPVLEPADVPESATYQKASTRRRAER